MELLDIIKKRRSIRKFKDEPIEKEKIHKIIEAGIWSPSSGNTMPFKFLILDEKSLISDFYSLVLDSVVEWKKDSLQAKELGLDELKRRYTQYLEGIMKAPVIILVFFDLEVGAQTFAEGKIEDFVADDYLYNSLRDSLFLCVENMLLEATALDLGSLYFELPRVAGSPANHLFNLPDTLEFFMSIPIGYSDEDPKPKERDIKDFLIKVNSH